MTVPPAPHEGEAVAAMPSDVAELTVPAGPSGPRPRMGRNITALTSGQVITWTMTLVWTLVVPRALGPAGMGIIFSAWSVTGVLGIVLGLGTRNYLVREMVVDQAESPKLVGTATVLRIVMAPIFVVAVIAYNSIAHYSPEGTAVLYLATGATFLTLLAEPMQAGFQAVERMEYLAYSDVMSKLAQGLLGVALALLGFRSVGITACWLIVSGAVVVADAVWLRPFIRIDLHTNARRMRDMAQKSFAYWAFGLFFMIYLWIDTVLLSLFTRPTVVGWYGVPTKLFQSLLFIPVILSTAWLPRFVHAFKDSPERLRQVARTPLELVLALSFPVCAATAVVAKPMIRVLYGHAYDKAVPVMILLAFCIPFMYLNIMFSQVLIAAKRQVLWTWVMAGATVVNPLFNIGLIPLTDSRYHNGAIGAAMSLVLTEFLIVMVGYFMVGRGVFGGSRARRWLRSATASAALAGAAYAARPLGTVLSLAAGGIAFLTLATVLRVATAEEIQASRVAARRLLRRFPVWRGRSRPSEPANENPVVTAP